MNKQVIFSFIAGASISSVATYFVVKKKYDEIVQEEVDSVKESFSKFYEEADDEEAFKKNYENISENYKGTLKNMQYVCDSENSMEPDETKMSDAPYVISPDEFGELDDYEVISLTYYKDGVLADDADDILDDVDTIVGEDSLERFGEYEPDCVYVRNDSRKCDYEILLDEREYSDVVESFRHRNGN